MRTRRIAGMAWVIGAAACASASKSAPNGPARWAGEFRRAGGSSTGLVSSSISSEASAYGTVTLTPDASGAERTRVDLSVTVPAANGQQLAWAVLMGGCGSAPAPVTGPSEFPLIDLLSNGSGTVRAVLPFSLDTHASYHANIYGSTRNTNEGDVIMCAKLERAGGR